MPRGFDALHELSPLSARDDLASTVHVDSVEYVCRGGDAYARYVEPAPHALVLAVNRYRAGTPVHSEDGCKIRSGTGVERGSGERGERTLGLGSLYI